MAKETSPKIVDEPAEYERRFKKLEDDSEITADTVARIWQKISGDKPEPSRKTDASLPPKPTGVIGFFQEIGLFRKE
jgi:hypothetical protein